VIWAEVDTFLAPVAGSAPFLAAVTVDITERKRAEEAFRELESDLAHINRLRMMGEPAASLAHEITQPMAAARNNARAAQNFLDKQPPDLGEAREALGYVVGDADRAGNIIDRIRDHIKKAPPRKHRFDLNEAINEVIVLARSELVKNGVAVQTRLAEGLSAVRADRVQVQQVVLNLVLNAVDAMSSVNEGPRELFISTEQSQAGGVLVSVCDSGPGLIRNISSAFSTLSTPPSPAEWGWGCRSAGPSSTPTGADCGQAQTSLEAPYFSSPCPARKGAHEFSLGCSPEWRAARRHRMRCFSSTGLRR
jgi:C4-dicarboxylate-specific signal transduction histidine kinase